MCYPSRSERGSHEHTEKQGFIGRNVAKLVDLPQIERYEGQILTVEQARKLLEVARGSRLDALLLMALTIGMSFYSGSFLALDTRSFVPFTVGVPPSTTYNYTLGSVGISRYILDLRNLPAGAVKDWAQGPRLFRVIGTSYDPAQASTFYYIGSLQQWFDVIINFQNTTAAHIIVQ